MTLHVSGPPCVADGMFSVRLHGEVQAFLVEIDMGTVSWRTMLLRYRAYYHWWKRGQLAARLGQVPLRVLTLTTTPSRLKRLREVAIRAPPGMRGSGLFWFSLLKEADLVHPERLLADVWSVARRGGPQRAGLFTQ